MGQSQIKSPQFSWNSAESMLGLGTAGHTVGLCYKKVTHDPGALILCEKDVKVTSKMVGKKSEFGKII